MQPAPCTRRRGTLTIGAPEGYPDNTVQVNNELRIILPCTLPTYDSDNHQLFIPTNLGDDVGQQNLAMLSRLNGPQQHIGLDLNPICRRDIVQVDPDDVLDSFAAMAMGAAPQSS